MTRYTTNLSVFATVELHMNEQVQIECDVLRFNQALLCLHTDKSHTLYYSLIIFSLQGWRPTYTAITVVTKHHPLMSI